jgi:hypothetical protein
VLSLAVTPAGKHAVVGGFQDTLAVFGLDELVRANAEPDFLRNSRPN